MLCRSLSGVMNQDDGNMIFTSKRSEIPDDGFHFGCFVFITLMKGRKGINENDVNLLALGFCFAVSISLALYGIYYILTFNKI